MIVGKQNKINEKLVSEISGILPIGLVEVDELLGEKENGSTFSPPVILVNLLDMDASHSDLINILKERYPDVKIIAVHAYKAESMIQSILQSGYDAYVSVFDLSNEFYPMLNKLGVV